MKIGCVLMAAGSARRFGENKLAKEVIGVPIFRRALETIPADSFEKVVVVTQSDYFSEYVKEYHFTDIHNNEPEKGISRTIRLGLSSLQECDGVLFSVSDQPLLRCQSVRKLVELWRTQPEKIASLGHDGQRGNPCIFPARFFPELMALRGDTGGGAVIRRHKEDLVILETDPRELMDVDTPEALDALLKELDP